MTQQRNTLLDERNGLPGWVAIGIVFLAAAGVGAVVGGLLGGWLVWLR